MAGTALLLVGGALFNFSAVSKQGSDSRASRLTHQERLFEKGKRIFRYDTFGDQDFWGGALQLHKAIEGRRLGGVGPGVSPKTALAVGLKVDVRALPRDCREGDQARRGRPRSPETTLALLKLNSVLGVKGFFNRRGTLRSVGITCAFCHSTVNDSLAPGIGKRLDGWPNQDLNVGQIVSLAPNLKPITDELGVDEATLKKVLLSWGPGFYDAEVNIDGKAFRPDGKSAATRIPAAYGHLGEDLHTWTGGFGDVAYWNAYVANLQMRGKGNFNDPRLNDPVKYPVAARTGKYRVRHKRDLVTPKMGRAPLLPALAAGAKAAPVKLQPCGGRPRQARLQRPGPLLELPHAAALHGRRLQRAQAGGDLYRLLPGRPRTRRHLRHAAAQGPLGAIEARLLPRRSPPDAGGGHRALQRLLRA